MAEYILATKFYNEQEQLPNLIENISKQTLKPAAILFVDDGSIDNSIIYLLKRYYPHTGIDFPSVATLGVERIP